MADDHNIIMIRLDGFFTDDDRIYVTSPDLKGFAYLLNKDEDPVEAMSPVLKIFVECQLGRDLEDFRVPLTPASYLKGRDNSSRLPHQVPEWLIASVA